ncbi:hypothetical protein Tco_1393546 [Tanacetum coccineum]
MERGFLSQKEGGGERDEGKQHGSYDEAARYTVSVVTSVVDESVVKNMGSNGVNLDYASLEKPLESIVGADLEDATSNSTPTTSESIPESVSFATLLKGDTSRKSVNFHTLNTLAGNGADVAVHLEYVRAVSERFANSAYGFFLGKRVAYPFSSKNGLDAMLENGPWFIRNNSLILKKWNPDVNLFIVDVGNVPVYYARAMIELRADVELKDNIVVAMTKLVGEGFYTCNIRVEYEWKPPGVQVARNNVNSSGKKKQVAIASKEVSNSNSFDVLNSVEKDDDLGKNGGHSKSDGRGPNSDVFSTKYRVFNVASSSTKIMDSDSEVEDVVDDRAVFMASTDTIKLSLVNVKVKDSGTVRKVEEQWKIRLQRYKKNIVLV